MMKKFLEIFAITFLTAITLPAYIFAQFSNLLTENFDACGTGTLPLCGWNMAGSGSRWTTTNSGCMISGSFSLAVGSDVTYCEYNGDFGSSDRIAYKGFSSSGFQLLDLSFNWKSLGEASFDYGKVVYSNDGVSWTDVSPTQYQGQAGTQVVSNLAIPPGINNDPTVFIGFRWFDDPTVKAFPGFVVDDLVIRGEQMTPAAPGIPTSNSPQCLSVTITRTGIPPSPSNVIWYWQGTSCGTSTILGSGPTFVTSSSGTYYIRAYNTVSGLWSGTCGSVAVTVDSPMPTANAGAGGNECDLNFTLAAVPSIGTGTWTKQSGPGTASYSPNANDPNAMATVTAYGAYVFRWTEVNGACSDFKEITVNFYQQPVANAGSGGNECDLSFTFSASPSAGLGTWTQQAGPGASGFVPSTNSPAATVTVSAYGTYTYRWTEVNGVCSDFKEITVNFYQQPAAVAGPDGNECDLNHSLSASPSVGSGLWTKQVGPGLVSYFPNAASSGALVTVTAYGTYIFRWTETNGTCSSFDDVTIIFYQQPSANAGASGIACGTLNYTFSAVPSAGTGTWSIQSGPGTAVYAPTANSPTATATVTTIGSYIFKWFEVNGICSDSDTVSVNFFNLPVVSFSGLAGPYCISDTFPKPLTGSPLGGTFSGNGIVGNNFYPNFAAVGNNTITYTYTDANTCTNSSAQVVSIIGLPIVYFSGLTGPYCEDDITPVALTGYPSGGTYTGPGILGNTFTPSLAGSGFHSITYTYTDGNGCTNFETQSVVVKSLPLVTFSGLNAAYCIDASVAALSGVPAGGTFSGPGISGNNFNPAVAGAGTHSITYSYTDSDGCTEDSTKSVTVNNLPVVSFSGLNVAYCIVASPSLLSGSPPGGVFSGNGISGNSFYPSVADTGTHTITYTYTDGNGCLNSQSQNTVVTTLPVVSFSGLAPAYCVDAPLVTLTPSPLGGTFSGPGISGNAFDPFSAGVGNHTIKYVYSDGGGCTDSTTQAVVVNGLPLVTFSGLNAAYCVDATAAALSGVPVGGTFSGPGISGINFDPAVAGLGAHSITYSYTDSNGCTEDSTKSVTVNGLPVVSFAGLDTAYCVDAAPAPLSGSPVGGSFSGIGISGSTFYPFIADTGSHIITYTYTDGNSCINTQAQSTNVVPVPVVSFSGLASAYCVDALVDTLTGSPLGGVFSGPGVAVNSFDPAAAGVGTHSIKYVYADVYGCSDSSSQTVIVHELPSVALSGLNSQYCVDAPPVALTGFPFGGSFSGPGITGNSFDPAVAGAGIHNITYTFTDVNGCTNDSVQTTAVNPLPSPVITAGGPAVFCQGDSVSLSTGATVFYLWNTGAITQGITVATGGNYSVTVTDTNACVGSSAPFLITVFPNPSLSILVSDVNCNNGTDGYATVTPSGTIPAYSYLWDPPAGGQTDSTATGLPSGTYHVTVTDGNSCISADSAVVGEPAAGVFLLTSSIVVSCNGNADGKAIASGSGGTPPYSYQWDDLLSQTSDTAVGLTAGNYNVSVTDNNGCLDSSSVIVSEPLVLSGNTSSSPVSCKSGNDGIAMVVVTGGTPGYSYLWNIGQVGDTAIALSAGNYSVTVTDSKGCIDTVSAVVTEPALLTLASSVTDVSCFGAQNGTATVVPSGGNPTYTYLWNNGQTTATANGMNGGFYSADVTDSKGCFASISVFIDEQPELIILTNSKDATIGKNDGSAGVTVLGGVMPYNYLWSDGQTDSVADGLAPGTYTIYVVDNAGCQATDTVEIKTATIEILPWFTPNDDGSNDEWLIGNLSYYPEVEVTILNRWGEKLFYSKGYKKPWDGTYKNKQLPMGSYFYIIDLNDGSKPMTGAVTILK